MAQDYKFGMKQADANPEHFRPVGQIIQNPSLDGMTERLNTLPTPFGDTGPDRMPVTQSRKIGDAHGKDGAIGQTAGGNIEFQRKPRIKSRADYLSIKSFLSRNRPQVKIEWEDVVDEHGHIRKRQNRMMMPVVMTEQERELMEDLSRPATKDIIAVHVARLAAHKRMPNDEGSAAVVVTEYTDFIFGEHAKEYEIYETFDWFITKDQSPWFPPLSKVLVALKTTMKHGYIDRENLSKMIEKETL